MAVVSKRSRSDVPSGADGLDEAVLRGMYRAMLLTAFHRGARPLPLPAGPDPRARSTRAAATRRPPSAWPGRWPPQDVGCPTQRDLGVHIVRGMAPWRIIAQYLGRTRRPDAGPRRQRPPRRHGPRHADDGLAPARDAAGRRRLRARLPRAQRAARRARLARRRRIGARRRARGDEPGRRAPPARSCSCSTTTASPTPRRRTSSTASTHLAERAAAYGFPGRGRRRHRRRRRLPRRAGRRSSARAAAAGRRCSSSSRCAWKGTRCTTTRSTCRPSCSPRGASATRSRARGRACSRSAAASTRPPTRRSASEVAREVDVAVELALASDWPDPATLTDGVYR